MEMKVVRPLEIHLLTCIVRPAARADGCQVLGSQGGGDGQPPHFGAGGGQGRSLAGGSSWGSIRRLACLFVSCRRVRHHGP